MDEETSKVLNVLQETLQKLHIITSPFHSILDGKLNPGRRFVQLLFILLSAFYVIPRNSFIGYLYLVPDETRKYYQYWIGDYLESMGTIGRTMNMGHLVFAVAILCDKVMLRYFESSGKLEFLTDLLTLKRQNEEEPEVAVVSSENHKPKQVNQSTLEGINLEEKKKLLASIKVYCKLAVVNSTFTKTCVISIDILSCSWFLYSVNPHWSVYVLSIVNFFVFLFWLPIANTHIFGMYLSFIITTDYFSARINSLLKFVEALKMDFTKENLTPVLVLYNQLMIDFKRQNQTIKHLLRNLVYWYCAELSLAIFVCRIQMDVWLRFTIPMAFVVIVSMMTTAVYIGQLHTRVLALYQELNCVHARSAAFGMKRRHVSLIQRLHLRLAIKELANDEVDGQFVVGLTDGNGAATSFLEMFDLTLQTVGYVLMVIQMTS